VKERKIKLLWAFLIMLAAFPATGLVCAIVYHDAAMFYWSLVSIPIAAVMIPVVFLGMYFLGILMVRLSLIILFPFIALYEKLNRRKK
jgi:uncharacterized membrane protein